MAELALELRIPAELNPDQIRVRMAGTPQHPLFNLADLCRALGYKDVNDAVRDWVGRLGEDRLTFRVDHPEIQGRRGRPTTYDKWFAAEPEFYRVVLGSGLPAAERFESWVYHEVLPSIRAHGCYPPPTVPRESAVVPLLAPYAHRVRHAWASRARVPDGHWSVFLESADLLIDAEAIYRVAGLALDQFDLLDGSVGTHWAHFREGKPWAGERRRYPHVFPPGDPRGTREAWCYRMAELGHFREWLYCVYLRSHFAVYLQRKYGQEAFVRALPAFRSRAIPLSLPQSN